MITSFSSGGYVKSNILISKNKKSKFFKENLRRHTTSIFKME